MPGISTQSEQYGLPEREASALPPKEAVADLLRGFSTTPGLMKRADEEEI